MRVLVTIGLRLLGVALVVYILAYQVEYVDHLFDVPGRLTFASGEAVFHPRDGSSPTHLGKNWREVDHLRPGLLTIVARSHKLLLALSVLFFGPITLISITRWWYLLRTVEVPTSFLEVFRLTFIGFFFNSAVPGMTGGDLVKGVYIARQAASFRVRAFMSVLVDRVIGLFALGLLAGLVLLPHLTDERFRVPAWIIFLFLAACLVLGSLFLSGRTRRLLRVDSLLGRLPMAGALAEVDRAVVIYRRYPRQVILAILMSVANHVALIVMCIGIGTAIGIDIPAVQYFMLYPVCIMLASIPLLPGGWGLREASFQTFFGMVGVVATQAVALSILIGLTMLAWSLLGGVFFLLRPDRVSRRDLAAFHEEVDREIEQPAS